MSVSPDGDRAGRPAAQAPAGLGNAATIPDADALLALAERCEAAIRADAFIDLAIARALQPNVIVDQAEFDECPYSTRAFTASLDAAMTLVPEGGSWNLHKHSRWARAGVFVDDGRDPGHYCDAATPALALCAAALRARAAQ